MKHLFIINPVAGGRNSKAKEVAEKITYFAEALKDPVVLYMTKEPLDATRKTGETADKLKPNEELRVYACGGDGTLNECVNGAVFRENVAVAQYPMGTGNDFLKTFSQGSLEEFQDLRALTRGRAKKLDVIRCTTSTHDRYGINICSIGIDARVGTDVHKYSRIPLVGGSTGYVVSLIINVIKGVTCYHRITCRGVSVGEFKSDDRIFDQKITLACACNGKYYGGGFNPVPFAEPDDDTLECLVVEPISRLKVAKIVNRYAKGRFREFPDVFNYIRCKEMEIEGNRDFVINIDGEGVFARKITFKVVHKGVNFIFPENF